MCELVWGVAELGTFVKKSGFGENTPVMCNWCGCSITRQGAGTASRPAGHPASHAEKRAGRLEKTGWPTGRPAGQNRLADRLAGRPADRPDHSVECAGCSKSGSGGLFLPIFFADGRKDALFLPPRGPPQPPPPRQRPRPLKPTTYRAPVPNSSCTLLQASVTTSASTAAQSREGRAGLSSTAWPHDHVGPPPTSLVPIGRKTHRKCAFGHLWPRSTARSVSGNM